MNRIYTLTMLLVICLPAIQAQDTTKNVRPQKQERHPSEINTLFDPHAGSGGYGAISVGYSVINGQDALLMGARGEWVIGHGFGLGVGGYGFINDPVYDLGTDLNYALAGGYGGLYMEPILMGWFPVHLSFPILIGAGGVASTSFSSFEDYYGYIDTYLEDATAFFVAEAGVELEFNMVRFFRMALFGSYRYTSDLVLDQTPADALKGWSAGVTFKFGSF